MAVIHSTYFLKAYNLLGTILGVRYTVVNKEDRSLPLRNLDFSSGRETIKSN